MAIPRHPLKPRALTTDSVRGEATETLEPVEIIAQLLANAAQRGWENREPEAVEGDNTAALPHPTGSNSPQTRKNRKKTLSALDFRAQSSVHGDRFVGLNHRSKLP